MPRPPTTPGRRQILRWPLAAWAALASSASPAVTGAVQTHDLGLLDMPGLGRQRRVQVWLPAGYTAGADAGQRYPVLYLQDGQNLADPAATPHGAWDVPVALQTAPAIVVGIHHGNERRVTELNPWSNTRFGRGEGEALLRFITETVKPIVDARWRTLPGRDDTAIGGSSLGALLSLAALRLQPQVFGSALVLSPALWIAPEVFEMAARGPWPSPTQVLMTIGDQEGDRDRDRYVADARRMAGLLHAQPGVRCRLRVNPGGRHDEAAWRAAFPPALAGWLDGRGRPA